MKLPLIVLLTLSIALYVALVGAVTPTNDQAILYRDNEYDCSLTPKNVYHIGLESKLPEQVNTITTRFNTANGKFYPFNKFLLNFLDGFAIVHQREWYERWVFNSTSAHIYTEGTDLVVTFSDFQTYHCGDVGGANRDYPCNPKPLNWTKLVDAHFKIGSSSPEYVNLPRLATHGETDYISTQINNGKSTPKQFYALPRLLLQTDNKDVRLFPIEVPSISKQHHRLLPYSSKGHQANLDALVRELMPSATGTNQYLFAANLTTVITPTTECMKWPYQYRRVFLRLQHFTSLVPQCRFFQSQQKLSFKQVVDEVWVTELVDGITQRDVLMCTVIIGPSKRNIDLEVSLHDIALNEDYNEQNKAPGYDKLKFSTWY